MMKYSLLVAALVLCALAAPARADPTIVNGDFETGANMFNTFPAYIGQQGNLDQIPGWTSPQPNVGLNPDKYQDTPFRDNGDNATVAAFLQGTASLTQTIAGFNVGSTYQLDFDYNSRNCCGDFPMLLVTLGVGFYSDGDPNSNQPNGIQPVDSTWVHTDPWYHGSFQFIADQTSLDLVISSQTVNGGDGTALIDNLVLKVISP
jgi:hypothetical protein